MVRYLTAEQMDDVATIWEHAWDLCERLVKQQFGMRTKYVAIAPSLLIGPRSYRTYHCVIRVVGMPEVCLRAIANIDLEGALCVSGLCPVLAP